MNQDKHKRRVALCLSRLKQRDCRGHALFYLLSGNEEIWEKGIENFFDFEGQEIRTDCFKRLGLSTDAKHLLYLAFHLYNDFPFPCSITQLFNELNLENRQLAVNAMMIRYPKAHTTI